MLHKERNIVRSGSIRHGIRILFVRKLLKHNAHISRLVGGQGGVVRNDGIVVRPIPLPDGDVAAQAIPYDSEKAKRGQQFSRQFFEEGIQSRCRDNGKRQDERHGHAGASGDGEQKKTGGRAACRDKRKELPIDFFFGHTYAQRIETKCEQGQEKQERGVKQRKGNFCPHKGIRNTFEQFRQRRDALARSAHCPLEIAGSQKAKQKPGKRG